MIYLWSKILISYSFMSTGFCMLFLPLFSGRKYTMHFYFYNWVLYNMWSFNQWLLPSEGGYLEAEGIEKTWRIKQDTIGREVDISSAKNQYDIALPGSCLLCDFFLMVCLQSKIVLANNVYEGNFIATFLAPLVQCHLNPSFHISIWIT